MPMILLALLMLATMTGQASAQQQRYYNSSGRSLGTASTDSQGTTVFRDAGGRVTGREIQNRQHDDDL